MNRLSIHATCTAFALAAAPAILAAADSPFPLVSGGKAAAIVIAVESEHSSRLASKELADYVEKSSGVRPRMLTRTRSPALGPLPSVSLPAIPARAMDAP